MPGKRLELDGMTSKSIFQQIIKDRDQIPETIILKSLKGRTD